MILEEVASTVAEDQLNALSAETYLRFNSSLSGIPAGKNRPVYIHVSPGNTVKTTAQLQDIVDEVPGAVWYILGEPNRQLSVDEVIEDLRYYYTEIKLVDPTARITSPSILNWDFTCIGCGGFTSGQSWMTEFIDRYQDLYGALPPWDIWAIDLYPLDWSNLPNTGFMPGVIMQYSPNLPPKELSIPATQLQQYRDYIDSLPGRAGEPILVTEIGIHWGWTEQVWPSACGTGDPGGEYKPLVIRDYLESVFSWFEENAISHNIEGWYTYGVYADIYTCRADGYAGLSLLTSGGTNPGLSDLGRWYVARSAP